LSSFTKEHNCNASGCPELQFDTPAQANLPESPSRYHLDLINTAGPERHLQTDLAGSLILDWGQKHNASSVDRSQIEAVSPQVLRRRCVNSESSLATTAFFRAAHPAESFPGLI
jgi:hypothetical protein